MSNNYNQKFPKLKKMLEEFYQEIQQPSLSEEYLDIIVRELEALEQTVQFKLNRLRYEKYVDE